MYNYKYNYNLGLYGLSRRGYRRDSLENRIIDHIVIDTTGLLV